MPRLTRPRISSCGLPGPSALVYLFWASCLYNRARASIHRDRHIPLYPRGHSGHGCISPSALIKHLQVSQMADASSSDATAKRQRTCLDLRGGHHVSARALVTVAKQIRLHGLPDAISRTTVHRQRAAFANRDTPFGKLVHERKLDLKKGGCISLPFLHPAAMLWMCCEQCPEIKEFFASVLQGQRLQIVEYADDKKLWVRYWSG